MDTSSMTLEQAKEAQANAMRARRKQALAMHRAGKTQKEIGEHFGLTRARAGQMIAEALKDEQT